MLTRFRQVALRLENLEGVLETLNANHLIPALSPKVTRNPQNIRRNVARGTLTNAQSRTGRRPNTIALGLEFAGDVDLVVGDPPPIGKALRLCGFEQVAVHRVTTDGFDNGDLMRDGATFTANNSGATGRIFGDLTEASGETNFFYVPDDVGNDITSADTEIEIDSGQPEAGTILSVDTQTGAAAGWGYRFKSRQQQAIALTISSGTIAAGEVVTGSVSGAKARAVTALTTSGTLTIELYDGSGHFNNGEAWTASGGANGTTGSTDIQLNFPSASIRSYEDGIQKTIKGARGTGRLVFVPGEIPRVDFELQGSEASTPADGANLDGSGDDLIATPPPFLAATIELGDEIVTPCFSTMNIDLGVELVERPCADEASGSAGFRIVGRTPTMTMDPEALQEAVFAAYGKAVADTQFRYRAEWGSDTMNRWILKMPGLQFENLNDGDRNGLVTWDGQIQVNGIAGSTDDEIVIINY